MPNKNANKQLSASGCAAPYLKHHTVPMCQVTWNALPTSSFSKRQVDDIFGVLEMWLFHLSTLATALENQEHGIHQQETTCEVAMKKGDDSIAGIIEKNYKCGHFS